MTFEPFSVDIPQSLPSRDALSAVELDTMMRNGLEQAKQDDSLPASEVFHNLRTEI